MQIHQLSKPLGMYLENKYITHPCLYRAAFQIFPPVFSQEFLSIVRSDPKTKNDQECSQTNKN